MADTMQEWAIETGISLVEKTSTTGKKGTESYNEDVVEVPDLRECATIEQCVDFFSRFSNYSRVPKRADSEQTAELRLKNALFRQLGTDLINRARAGMAEDDSPLATGRAKLRDLATDTLQEAAKETARITGMSLEEVLAMFSRQASGGRKAA